MPCPERATGHGRRNAAEAAFSRPERLLGAVPRALCLEAQRLETSAGVRAPNRMAELGMPATQRIP